MSKFFIICFLHICVVILKCVKMNIRAINSTNSNLQPNFLSKTSKEEFYENYPKEKVGGLTPSIGAFAAGQIATTCSLPISLGLIIPAMQKQGNISEAEIKTLKEGTLEVIKKSGLDKTGVKINWIAPFKKAQNITDVIKADLMFPFDSVKNGRNAFFVQKNGLIPSSKGAVNVTKNTILMPKNKITYAAYHELGHAMNANLSKFGKTLQSCRMLSMTLPTLIALYGAFSRKSKPDTEGKLTTTQKINNGIRNNAGILAFATTIPMLLEEGMATKKGLKFAKEILKPDLYKKVVKGNTVAFLSYLTASIFAGLGAWATVKTKDYLIAKKERKQEELYRSAITT